MKWDFRNKPTIEDRYHSKFIITEKDLCSDCGDCVHVRHPVTKEEWRFYYTIDEDGNKIIESCGIIQL